MEAFSALLAICAGNSPVPGELPTQRPVTRSFDVFFDLRLNKRLSKQSWGRWFETLPRPLWRHSNVKQPAIIRVDPNLCRHMASIGYDGLIIWKTSDFESYFLWGMWKCTVPEFKWITSTYTGLTTEMAYHLQIMNAANSFRKLFNTTYESSTWSILSRTNPL